MTGRDWTKTVDYNIDRPYVFFGLHACDINALNKLDKVLMGTVYPMPYYAAKRKNMFIIGIDCRPQPFCFCRSMGTDTVLHGFDLFLTDIGDRYFVEILSAAAYDIAQGPENARARRRPTTMQYMKVVAEKNEKFTAHVDTTDLTKILDMEFQSPVWKQWGDKCLGCGTCANVCPTCYCYGVEETVDVDLKNARKTKTALFLQPRRLCRGRRRPQLPARAALAAQVPLLPQAPRLRRGLRGVALRRLRPLRRGLPGRHHRARGHRQRPRGGALIWIHRLQFHDVVRPLTAGYHRQERPRQRSSITYKAEITSVYRLTEHGEPLPHPDHGQ